MPSVQSPTSGGALPSVVLSRSGTGSIPAGMTGAASRPCPRCLRYVPIGSGKHIYRAPDAVEAVCGHLRDPEPPATPMDPWDPDLCERCFVLEMRSYRILPGMRVSLGCPIVFRPAFVPGP